MSSPAPLRTLLVGALLALTACGASDEPAGQAAAPEPAPTEEEREPSAPAEVPALTENCEALLTPGEVPRETGGFLDDGRWVNHYTVVDEQRVVVDVPVNEDTLSITGTLCCYCEGRLKLKLPELEGDLLAAFGTVLTSGAVCDETLPDRMLEDAAARGGFLPAVLAVITKEAIQGDAEGRCIAGTYDELSVQFTDCESDESWLGLMDYTYEETGELVDQSCADQ